MYKQFYIFFIIVSFCGQCAQGDWSQLQGDKQSGISDETNLARQWPKEGPELLWAIDVNNGFGGATIKGNDLYFMDRSDDDEDLLRCINFTKRVLKSFDMHIKLQVGWVMMALDHQSR